MEYRRMPVGDLPGMKSKVTAAVLCWFLGFFGIHRFYMGKPVTGFIMLFLGGLTFVFAFSGEAGLTYLFAVPVAFWAIVDFITIICGKMEDGHGELIE